MYLTWGMKNSCWLTGPDITDSKSSDVSDSGLWNMILHSIYSEWVMRRTTSHVTCVWNQMNIMLPDLHRHSTEPEILSEVFYTVQDSQSSCSFDFLNIFNYIILLNPPKEVLLYLLFVSVTQKLRSRLSLNLLGACHTGQTTIETTLLLIRSTQQKKAFFFHWIWRRPAEVCGGLSISFLVFYFKGLIQCSCMN